MYTIMTDRLFPLAGGRGSVTIVYTEGPEVAGGRHGRGDPGYAKTPLRGAGFQAEN